jgi:hypothetical protein
MYTSAGKPHQRWRVFRGASDVVVLQGFHILVHRILLDELLLAYLEVCDAPVPLRQDFLGDETRAVVNHAAHDRRQQLGVLTLIANTLVVVFTRH